MDIWIRDLPDFCDYSFSQIDRWASSGRLDSYMLENRRIIRLKTNNILVIRSELEALYNSIKRQRIEKTKAIEKNQPKYKDMIRFAGIFKLTFDKENFTLNGMKLKFLSKKRHDGYRYYIGEIDLFIDFYGENKLKLRKKQN